MQAAPPRLHPVGLADLLDTTFALYRQNFALFAGVAAVLVVPETIVNMLITASFSVGSFSYGSGVFSQTSPSASTVDLTSLTAMITAALLAGIVALLAGLLITGALSQAISERYLGRPTSVTGAYAAIGVGTFATLLLASILETIIVGVGFVFLVIPGIFLAIRFAFVPQAVVLERRGPAGGLSRSWELVRGSWWRVFGILLVVYIMVAILSSIVQGVVAGAVGLTAGSTTAGLLRDAAGGVVNILVQPIQLGVSTLLYYDLRIRKEGFDLELLSQMMERNQPT